MKKYLIILAFVFLTPSLSAQPGSTDPNHGTYIVLLKAPSVVERVLETTHGESRSVRRQILFSRATADYQLSLKRSQLKTIETLTAVKPVPGSGDAQMATAPRITVLDRRSFLLNLLVVRCSSEALIELRKHPDVKGVYPNRKRRLHMDSAPSIVSAVAVWEMLGGINSAGQGVRIGIIDTGINQAHPMLTDPSLTAPSGFPQPPEFSAYTSGKVIVARDYVKAEYGYRDQDVHMPEDENGHGTSVASVAAGVPVTTPYAPVQGMAPKAYLGNYKVFGKPGTNDDAMTAGVTKAIENAVEDQMDVINLSLGGLAQPPETDPEQLAIKNATEAGVLVVISAGNGGPNPGTVTSPGTSPEALTVGATLHGRYFASGMEVTSADNSVPPSLALLAYVPAGGQIVSTKLGPFPLASILAYDPSGEGCSSFPAASLTGKMALLRRGTCTFREKAQNAIDAGASGVVVYQNREEPPIPMGNVNTAHLAVMIEKGAGEALQTLLPGHSLSVTLRPQSENFTFSSQKNQIASFSGRGPDIMYQLKPDIVAPGQDILAASTDTASGYQRGLNGTSFSTPIAAGAAALIFQLHPTWTSKNVKSSLVNTADRGATWNGEEAKVIETGNGRLNVEKAAGIAALLDPVSMSFGVIDEVPSQDLESVLTVTNPSSTASQILSAELVETGPHPSVQLSIVPLALTLGPGQSGQFTVKARVVSPLQYGTFEGYLKLSSSISSAPVSASYWGAFPVEDRTQLLKVSQDGSTGYDSLSAAIVAARPGATIEIQDSGTYSGSLTIGANEDGLPLHGLTLRARTGQSPILHPGSSDTGIVVSGARHVTLEGLTILQGYYGLIGMEATGIVRNSVLDSNNFGAGFENSQFSLQNTTIRRSTSAGLLGFDSRLNVADSTIQENGEEGVFLFDSPTLVQRSRIGQNKKEGIVGIGEFLSLFDSTVEKNQATGLILFGTSALLKGNQIKDTTGQEPDGIAAVGDLTLWAQDNQILNNGRYGIAAESQPKVHFLRNRVTDNRSYGFYLSSASGTIESSWLTGNGRGIRIGSSDLDISNSVISGSTSSTDGDGIYADKGTLTVRNSTIAKNQKKGLRIAGSAHLVANSILYQNSAGDLDGGQQSGVKNNIISDGVFSGINGNQATDPRFTDPLTGDFSLGLGSAAIDTALPDFPSGEVDALSRERTVDGNGDGQAVPDIGALEYNSKNGNPLILPVLSTSLDEFVGLAMVNSSAEAARLELSGFDTSGGPVACPDAKKCAVDVAAGSQFATLLSEALPNLKQGWVKITSNKPDLMSFTLLGKSGLTQMDGAELSGAISSRLLLPEIRKQGSSDTQLFIVNPNPEEVEVVLRYHTATQNTLLVSRKISARGAFSRVFSSFGGGSVNGGYVTVEVKEQKPVFAMEIFTNGISTAGLLGLDMTRAHPTLFGAQLASTAAVDTILNVVNAGTTAADVTLEAFDEGGNLLKSVVVSKLGAGKQFRKTATEIFGLGNVVGWARVSAKDGQLVGCLSFSDTNGNFLASLPLQTLGAREFVLGHVAQTDEVFTGVTLLNAGTSYAEVSLEVFDKTGVSKGMALFELKPAEKRARLLTEYVPELSRQEGGFVRVRSSSPIFGFELFGHNLLRFMSAVPQQVVVY